MSVSIRDVSAAAPSPRRDAVKVLVWDLDNTLWEGVLAEGDAVALRPNARRTIEILDQRGILQSIASKNSYDQAMQKLREFGLDEYFLYPEISWSAKSNSLERIANHINVNLDSLAFIDDERFEREEVRHRFSQVHVLSAEDLSGLVEREEFTPRFLTDDSSYRRQMYMADMKRNRTEADFDGPQEAFLASLEMRLSIDSAGEEDLQRAEELTVRTHQLNTTGYTYSFEELNQLRQSPDHSLLICSLVDRFGTYGKIGLVLVEKRPRAWTLKLLLMSCRVMSRGVGSIVINELMTRAKESDVQLLAEFRPNGRNRMMLITYKFAGFREIEQCDGLVLLQADLTRIQPHPGYVELKVGW